MHFLRTMYRVRLAGNALLSANSFQAYHINMNWLSANVEKWIPYEDAQPIADVSGMEGPFLSCVKWT